jgi:SM-20-related protein
MSSVDLGPPRATAPAASLLDIAALEATRLQHAPFDHVIVRDFIGSTQLDAIINDFPDIPGPGSHPPSSLKIRKSFAALLDELHGDSFRHALERKFEIDLTGRPAVTTIRGELRRSDGRVHTDSHTKLITALLYLNEDWQADGGRLRLLRSPDPNDFAVEIAPEAGTLIVFRRGENSWHGHAPFAGRRRAIQMSYVVDRATAKREERRHRIVTSLKRVARAILTRGRA